MQLEIPVPYAVYRSDDQQSKFITMVKDFEEYISSIYLPIGYVTKDACSFGIRNAHVEGGVDMYNIEVAHRLLVQELSIPVKILCNDLYANVLHANFDRTIKKIEYYKQYCQIKSIVLSDFLLMDKFKESGLPICLSVNSVHGLNGLSHALLYDDERQIKQITFDRDLNRNVNQIHDFLDSHKKYMHDIECVLLVNEGCAPYCPYKQAGDIEIVMDNSIATQHVNVHAHGCNKIKNHNPWLFLASPMLTYSMLQRPEYQGFMLKIAGRNLDAGIIRKILEHYVSGENLQLSELNNIHQLGEVSTSQLTKEFEDTVLSCDKQCFKCMKCKTFYNQMVGSADVH